jgi:hypothetical protein
MAWPDHDQVNSKTGYPTVLQSECSKQHSTQHPCASIDQEVLILCNVYTQRASIFADLPHASVKKCMP